MNPEVARLASLSGMDAAQEELLQITHQLLAAIHSGDLDTYRALCLPDLSCYETDVAPFRIDLVEFHIDLMREQSALGGFKNLTRFDLLTPRVQVFADSAIVTYTRLMTYAAQTPPVWRSFNETRVFVRTEQGWKLAHFHRSETR